MKQTVINQFKFKLILIEQVGATDFSFDDQSELIKWLRKEGRGHWHDDAKQVSLMHWRPGLLFQFKCGWIFCVE